MIFLPETDTILPIQIVYISKIQITYYNVYNKHKNSRIFHFPVAIRDKKHTKHPKKLQKRSIFANEVMHSSVYMEKA